MYCAIVLVGIELGDLKNEKYNIKKIKLVERKNGGFGSVKKV